MLELPAVLDADRDADKMDRHVQRQLVIHADFIKIGMIIFPTDRFDLQFLDQGKLAHRFFSLDEQLDEDIFPLLLDDLLQIVRVDRQMDRLLAAAVKHGRDQPVFPGSPRRTLAGFAAWKGF